MRFSTKTLLERSDDLFSCSCRRSKLSCIGCINAHNRSTQACVIPSSLRLRLRTTFLPTASLKLEKNISKIKCQ